MLFKTLSGRLLLLTVVFVMIAEVLIFLPSVSRFRVDFLRERLERAQIASLALLATPDDMVAPELEQELLANADVLNIVLQREARRELVLSAPMPRPIAQTVDLREETVWSLMRDAVICMLYPTDRVIRVVGPPVKGGGLVIEVAMEEAPLRDALLRFGGRVLVLSLAISIGTAVALFLAARRFITAPMARVAQNMIRFQENPEDAGRIITPSSNLRELAEAERALMDMQSRLNAALRQKDRLAALGGAVARISHDLRNMLTTAQLLADRIDASPDPTVRRVAPRLLASLDRAISLCERTLAYGRAEEPLPELRRVRLHALVQELAEAEFLAPEAQAIAFENAVPEALTVEADRDQLYRVLDNLIRNARQALQATGRPGMIAVSATADPTGARICVRDSGPGLPNRVLDSLFQPFRGASRPGGSGLGLAIAAELVRGHGGSLELLETSTEGTAFRIFLPRQGNAAKPAEDNTSPLHPAGPADRYTPQGTRSSAG
jgi:signal transduction histidine kinase